MEEEQTKDLKDYLVALRRRKKQILSTMGVLFVVSLLVAFLLPPVYRSTATILIEEQEIPTELVRSTITSYADQRIQEISQRVMTRANLMQLVEKYNLYPSQRRRETSEEILERMRKDIKLDIISADVIDKRSGMKTMATIAFTLTFNGETPDGAQKVANELTSLYLNENLKNRQQKSAETSTFLTEEAEKLSQHIAETEKKLAIFKAKNMNRLPELAQLNMSLRDRTDSEAMDVGRQISMAEERKFYLEGQLAQINPGTFSVSASGERILNSEDRLKSLQSQYASMAGVYSPNHPDVVKMGREIEALKKETGSSGDTQEQMKRLTALRGELATMREKYSEDHPDAVKLKKSIASLEESIKKSTESSASARAKKPENPAYITLQAQLESTVSELKSLNTKREELKAKMASYEAMLQQTPQVEREYLDLSRDHENSARRYQEIKAKEMEAQVAQELEKGSKGERFSLIDPPQLPEKPASPNRPAIVLLGLILSIGGGVGYAGILESMDASVRGSKALIGLVQAPLLGIIPYVENAEDKKRAQKERKILVFSVVGGIGILLLLIHFFWLPLDVVWYKAMRILEGYTPEMSKQKAG